MFQTSYLGIDDFANGNPFLGGICQLWFIPREEVLSMPPVNPANQYLTDEIILLGGKSWRGPVNVPDDQLGLSEKMELSKGGISYTIQLSAMYPGDAPPSRVNMENMPYAEFIVVAKLRAGRFYVVIGNLEKGATFTQEFASGSGSATGGNVSTKIAFTHQSINKPLVLESFAGQSTGGDTGVVNGLTLNSDQIYINGEALTLTG